MFAYGRFKTLLKTLSGARRRGTILLLVLGALAMVLILTVVYAALGKGDRTTGRAVNQQRDASEVVDRFGLHVAEVIGADVHDIEPDLAEERLLTILNPAVPLADLANFARYRLETTDAPVSDFSMLSVPSLEPGFQTLPALEQELIRFRPSGGHSAATVWPAPSAGNLGSLGGLYPTDPRIAADPWLASTRPTDFGVGSKNAGLVGGGAYLDIEYYARALDWVQISNLAPDGRFVNLAYLRDNFGAPSLDLTRDPDTGDPRLTLFDVDGVAVDVSDDFVLGFAGVVDYAGTQIDGGGNVTPNWNVPAHWTMYQRNMARTVAELSRNGFNTNDPSDPRYWEYSYADADGDGIIDSRWFELVDASSGFEVPLLGESNRRYFAAVRVIDLSALVNVNTAMDRIEPPSQIARAGQGTNDVSLFTLLTLDMHSQVVTDNGVEFAYADAFEGEGRNNYEDLDNDEHVRQARKAYLRLRESVRDWSPALVFQPDFPNTTGVPGEENEGADWSADLRDYTPYLSDLDEVGDGLAVGAERRREDHSLFGTTVPGFAGGGNARTSPFGVSDLIELLTFHGANDPEVFSGLELAFTADNTDEDLRTRSLLRSDRSLDAELGVELTTATGATLTPEELNRHARAQLDIRSLLTTISGSRPIRSVTTDNTGIALLSDAQRRYRADQLMLGSPRYEGDPTVLTAPGGSNANLDEQSNARNPLIRNGFEIYASALAPHLNEFAGGTAWQNATGTLVVPDHARTLFYGHSGPEMALRIAAHMAVNFRDSADAPFVDISGGSGGGDGVPDPIAIGFNELDTNDDGTIDDAEYAQRRDEPSRGLLWLVQEADRDLTLLTPLLDADGNGTLDSDGDGRIDDTDIAELDADALFARDFNNDGTIDDTETVLAQTSSATPAAPSADAMIVYGVEAQPFLSEVFYFNAYWDAPRAPGVPPGSGGGPWTPGDTTDLRNNDLLTTGTEAWGEYAVADNVNPLVGDFQNNDDLVRGTINIDGEVADVNQDFLFQVLVFQLFNPFDVAVSLNDYYIEFGESLYRPRTFGSASDSIILTPGETVLLFATNPGVNLATTGAAAYLPIMERINLVATEADGRNGGFTAPTFGGVVPSVMAQNIIETIVPDDASLRLPLERFDLAGNALTPTAIDDLLAGDVADYGEYNPQNTNVLLWWDLGDKQGTTGSSIEWRRDDLLADRLSDPGATQAGETPALDQRLRLQPAEIIDAGLVNTPPDAVQNAITGDGFSIDGVGPVAFGEQFESSMGRPGMNAGAQRSIGLWARLRRFDASLEVDASMTAIDGTTGGRRANDLPGPDGMIPSDPPTVPSGINPGAGDNAVFGLPSGALPAASLATNAPDAIETVEDNEQADAGPFTPTELWFDASFTDFSLGTTISRNYEGASTLNDFIVEQLGGINGGNGRFKTQRQATFLNSVLDATRYLTGGPNDAYLDVTANTSRTDTYGGSSLLQISRNSREFRTSIDGFPQLRVGDLLNVIAVGPYRMPLRTTAVGPDGYPPIADPVARAEAYIDQWTTLSEALGVAEGTLDELESPAGANTDVFEQLAGVLDRGHLRLDDFVPYVDAEDDDGDGSFANDPFNPVVDRIRGLGIPAALSLFDIAQAGGDLPDRAYGGIASPIAGTVNINTAAPSVLRTLPGVYRDVPDTNDGVPTNAVPAWSARIGNEATGNGLQVAYPNVMLPGSADPGLPSGSISELYGRLDVASSILSYREPASGAKRLLRGAGLAGSDIDEPLNMGPFAALDQAGNPDLTRGVQILRDAVDTSGDGVPDLSNGPAIPALRTAPGFGSIGELMAVRSSGEPGGGVAAARFQFGMDWTARDRRTVSQIFVDPTTGDPAGGEPDFTDADAVRDFIIGNELRIVSLDPSLLGDPIRFSDDAGAQFQLPVADQIPDDYDEQLVQINMLANAVSTSSDFYAAWIVVHGFEDDDVEDLDDSEPMRPSFRGRYLMIVDRSNVVSRGQPPRVLAYLRVPYGEEVRNPVYQPE